MRIVICAAFYPPYRGGYAESVRILAEGLVARGNAVTVIACDAGNLSRTEIIRGVVVRRVPAWNPRLLHGSFPIPYPFAFWRELRFAHAEGVDSISTQTRFFLSTFLGFLFAKIYGIRVVHTERGSAHTVSDSRMVCLCGKIIDHTAGWFVCRFSDTVIGVSNAACVFAHHLGAQNPVTIHNGIDADWWRLPEDRINRIQAFHIAFVGRLVYGKGVQDILVAVAFLISASVPFRISVVGVGPYRTALETRARELHIAEAVHFYGGLDADAVRAILAQADVFVNPSYSEGFPRSVLEAAAVGLPIIATDVGGTGEIIENGVTGILIPPHNPSALTEALRYLLADAPSRHRMGEAAHERAKQYSISRMISLYETHFVTHAVL